jgi:hypothetical protein
MTTWDSRGQRRGANNETYHPNEPPTPSGPTNWHADSPKETGEFVAQALVAGFV